MSEQSNQIGEISVGVTANTGMLEAGLAKAESKVQESAQKMEDAQAKAAEAMAQAQKEAAKKIEEAHKKAAEEVAKAHTGASAQVVQGAEQSAEGAGKFADRMRSAKQSVEQFGQTPGMLRRIYNELRDLYAIGSWIGTTFRTMFVTSTESAEDFLKTLEDKKAVENVKALDDQIAALQARLGQSKAEALNAGDIEANKSIQAQIEMLSRWRKIYSERAQKEEDADKAKAREAESLAEAKAVGETFKRLNAMRKAALRERMTDEERIIDDTNQKIEEAELELLRFKSVGRIEQAERVEEIIADIRETGLQKLADLQKKQDDERRKAAEEEAEQYQQDMFEKIAMQVELAEAQRKAAEEYAKQFEAYAQRIQDAMTNAFNASNYAAQAMTRQVNSDISQIIPLLQQLVRNQRR